jgi:ribose transport system substrate-binding protein
MHANFPNIKVLGAQVEGLDPVQAVAKAVSIMQANPDITGAFSTTGGGPQTWAGAQKQTNKKIMAIGMDYTRANLDLVKSGQIYAIVAQPLWPEAQGTADLLDKLHRGQKIPWWTKLPAPIVTKDKLGPYLAILDKVDAAAKKG